MMERKMWIPRTARSVLRFYHATIERRPMEPAQAERREEAKQGILEEVAEFTRRFVYFPYEEFYLLVAAWIVSTHLTKVFDYAGYLFAWSPEPQSGKSRLLEVLDLLVNNSSQILVSPTEAVLFRTAHEHTQLLDEIDSWTNRDELRSVLNAGFRRGGAVPRMKEEGSDFTVMHFPVFGPRALAGIGTTVLGKATRDRTFMLEMVRQTKGERREQLRPRKIGPEASRLKQRISEWAHAHEQAVERSYEDSEFPYLDHFMDRTIDLTEPLAAVIEVAFGDRRGLDQARRDLVSAVRIARDEQDSPEEEHQVLRVLEHLARKSDPLVGSASELAALCNTLAPPPGENEIGSLLRRYGFKNKSIRRNGAPGYRYELSHSKLADILARYGGQKPGPQQETESTEHPHALREPIYAERVPEASEHADPNVAGVVGE
jgi:hypothetical protein